MPYFSLVSTSFCCKYGVSFSAKFEFFEPANSLLIAISHFLTLLQKNLFFERKSHFINQKYSKINLD
jgi:hypothetical protein